MAKGNRPRQREQPTPAESAGAGVSPVYAAGEVHALFGLVCERVSADGARTARLPRPRAAIVG
jgi:hypothetical protein